MAGYDHDDDSQDYDESEMEEEEEEEEDNRTQPSSWLGTVCSELKVAQYAAEKGNYSKTLFWHSFSHSALIYHLNSAILHRMFPSYHFSPVPRFFVEPSSELDSARAQRRNTFWAKGIQPGTQWTYREWGFAARTWVSGFHYGHCVDLLCELVGILRNFPISMQEIPVIVLELLQIARGLGFPISEYKQRERLYSKEWIESCQYAGRPEYHEQDVDDTADMPEVGQLEFECEQEPYADSIGRTLVYVEGPQTHDSVIHAGGADCRMKASLFKPAVFLASKENEEGGRAKVMQQAHQLESQIIETLTDTPFQKEFVQMWRPTTVIPG